MRAMRKISALIVLSAISSGAVSYDRDVHYYVTAMILADLDKTNAKLSKNKLLAALSNQYVDDNDNTLPTNNPFKPQQRRNWHFPAEMEEGFFKNDYGTVKRNSSFAKHNVNRGLQENNPTLLGMALHTYFDSFAHEGYSAYFGHASAGHDPDRPHLDRDKLRELVSMTYKIISQWYSNNGIQVDKNIVPLDKYYNWAAYVPPSYGCITCSYESGEISERSSFWFTEISTAFPKLDLPVYYFLSGNEKNVFEGVASFYLTPYSEDKAIGIEWYSKQFSNILNLSQGGAISKAFVPDDPSPDVNDVNDVNAQFFGMKPKEAAIYALDNPDLIRNGLPDVLNNRAGILELFRAANKADKGWVTLYQAAASSHNYGVDWSKYSNEIRPLLTSKNVDKRLFAIGALSISKSNLRSTCNSINRFYSNVDLEGLSDEQKDFLVNTVRNDPGFIADCSTESLGLLSNFLSDDLFGGQAASRLYKISSNEYSSYLTQEPQITQAIMNVRTQAKVMLEGYGGSLAKRNPLPKSFSNSKAFSYSVNDIKYWTVRSYEDFDDDVRDSRNDREDLLKLERGLAEAVLSKNLDLISGYASTIATFRSSDNPPASLINSLKQYLLDPNLTSVSNEIRYAIESLQSLTL